MRENHAFWKSIALLFHPLSLLAMLLLLLNDHLFRLYWPSWWTGKLGDFAWLFFFPFAVAVMLSLLVPKRITHQARWVGLLAFGLVGIAFTLGKTLPGFHSLLVRWMEAGYGFPVSLRRDPTDLVALLSLAGSGWMWLRVPIPSSPPRRPACLLLPLAMLLTVANSAQPDPGVSCLIFSQDKLLACSAYECYSSSDGGHTWLPADFALRSGCPSGWNQTPEAGQVSDPLNPSIQYRYTPGGNIERSADGGQSWPVDDYLQPPTQAERMYYIKTHQGNASLSEVPLAALADPSSGNIFFAMGHEGVLVRHPDGSYTWEMVGVYGHVDQVPWRAVPALLTGEVLLAVLFGALGLITLAQRWHGSWIRLALGFLAWFGWSTILFVIPPALQEGPYGSLIAYFAISALAIMVLPLMLDAFFLAGTLSRKLLPFFLLVLVGGGSLFLFPYILWAYNILPNYYLAVVFAVLLGGGFLYTLYRRLGKLELNLGDLRLLYRNPAMRASDVLYLLGMGLVVVGIVLTGLFVVQILPAIGPFAIFIGVLLVVMSALTRRKAILEGRQNPPQED